MPSISAHMIVAKKVGKQININNAKERYNYFKDLEDKNVK